MTRAVNDILGDFTTLLIGLGALTLGRRGDGIVGVALDGHDVLGRIAARESAPDVGRPVPALSPFGRQRLAQLRAARMRSAS